MDLSTQPQLIKTDKNTVTKYYVAEVKYDLGALEIEKRGIEEQLAKVVGEKELLEWAKANYPYQNIDRVALEARKLEIENILGVK